MGYPSFLPHWDGEMWHHIVDDEDDHRILISECRRSFGYIHAKGRESWPWPVRGPTCLFCILKEDERWP